MKIQQMYVQSSSHNYLPSFEANTWMKTNVVQESWIYKGQREIRHTTQFN